MPYLRIFDKGYGLWDSVLDPEKEAVIGRNPSHASIVLNDPHVSRAHASIRHEPEGWVIRDQVSRTGIRVAGHLVKQKVLAPGDMIEIGHCMLEYRDGNPDDDVAGQAGTGDPVQAQLRRGYRLLPTSVCVRVRKVGLIAEQTFKAGDTVQVGGGGILIPIQEHFEEGTVVELDMTAPGGGKHAFLGEIVGWLGSDSEASACIKIHGVDAAVRHSALTTATRGAWYRCWPPRDTISTSG